MRIKIYIAVLLFLSFLNGYSQAKGPEAYFNYASFNTPSGSSYFETYLTISGNTVRFSKNDDDKYQCKVKVSVKFLRGDSVKFSDTYNLLSVETMDTAKKPDFSAVQRYWLPNGGYTVQIKMEDKNNPKAKIDSGRINVHVGYSADSMSISDAEFIASYSHSQHPASFTKSGYDMVPYSYSSYPPEIKTLNFYTEIYNSTKVFAGSKFVIKYFIENADDHVALRDFANVAVYKPDTVIPVLGGFNIEKLPTGKYNLVVAVIDKNDKIIMSRGFGFYRSNRFEAITRKDLGTVSVKGTFAASIRMDSLTEDVKSLYPIADKDDRRFIDGIDKNTDSSILRRFFYNFWVSHNPSNPEKAWIEYYKQVKLVNSLFGTVNKKGYQSDRGRVYLQYGAPSQRDIETINPVTYPYEIWEYYRLNDGESDRKFVFYEPSLATNDFILLHSTAKGEVQNRQWQLVLYSQTIGPYSVDQNSQQDPFGEDANDQFSNPR
ncbi:MAG: GWxTD domain-containing protein [Bacteroidia bacterium]